MFLLGRDLKASRPASCKSCGILVNRVECGLSSPDICGFPIPPHQRAGNKQQGRRESEKRPDDLGEPPHPSEMQSRKPEKRRIPENRNERIGKRKVDSGNSPDQDEKRDTKIHGAVRIPVEASEPCIPFDCRGSGCQFLIPGHQIKSPVNASTVTSIAPTPLIVRPVSPISRLSWRSACEFDGSLNVRFRRAKVGAGIRIKVSWASADSLSRKVAVEGPLTRLDSYASVT